ncbi:MAG: hypothetical protein ACYTG0_33500, partial [Planctomycetota bacterium]
MKESTREASADCKEWDARPNTFWICCACGKWGKNRATIGDESCFMNAVLLEGKKPERKKV